MDKLVKQLYQAVVAIDTEKMAAEFLENILTPGELEDISRRIEIFKMLQQGVPQRTIAETLNVSIATVTRGSRELKYGKPGIINVLKRMEEENPAL